MAKLRYKPSDQAGNNSKTCQNDTAHNHRTTIVYQRPTHLASQHQTSLFSIVTTRGPRVPWPARTGSPSVWRTRAGAAGGTAGRTSSCRASRWRCGSSRGRCGSPGCRTDSPAAPVAPQRPPASRLSARGGGRYSVRMGRQRIKMARDLNKTALDSQGVWQGDFQYYRRLYPYKSHAVYVINDNVLSNILLYVISAICFSIFSTKLRTNYKLQRQSCKAVSCKAETRRVQEDRTPTSVHDDHIVDHKSDVTLEICDPAVHLKYRARLVTNVRQKNPTESTIQSTYI